MTLREIEFFLGGNKSKPLPEAFMSRQALSFSQDSRALTPGSVFVCTKGEQVDGHDFAAAALEKGAIALIAERDPFYGQSDDGLSPVPLFLVENSLTAVTALAAERRRQAARRGVKVVGITGTAGKTSVKEVLAAVLGAHAPTAKNFMNMNNQWGLPLSMLNAAEDADFWVLEAGISHARDMDELAGLLQPDLALILNVGPGHLSGLGDRGVAYYKSRLLAHLADNGLALLNADYPDLMRESDVYQVKRKFFSSLNSEVDFYASYNGPVGAAGGYYLVKTSGQENFEVSAPFRGSYGAENVAAIAGAATLLGLTGPEIKAGMSGAVLPRQRFNCRIYENTVLIDDSYNANPLSAARMLESAAEIAREQKLPLLLVMGEMLELGEEASAVHLELGKKMAASGAQAVIWKGGRAEEVRQGLDEAGFQGGFALAPNEEEFRGQMGCLLKKSAGRGAVLFKASRANRLERFVEVFQKEFCVKN
jgi:UDP-N-acetylmuramoyl-tripeptide--D-alanyl-D-alanine ligase